MVEQKTNAMRILDKAKIGYEPIFYECDEFVDAVSASEHSGTPPELTYKTIIVQGKSERYYAVVVPSEKETDLKKAAKAVGEKSVEPIHVKDINRITGYVRGGCSPLGIKRRCDVIIDASIMKYEQIFISGGRLGCSLRLDPKDLVRVSSATVEDVVL